MPGRVPQLRALIGLLTAASCGLVLGAQAGAALAVARADDAAHTQRAAGDYGRAVAGYRALAGHHGPLVWMNHGPVDRALSAADHTVLDWATALAHEGKTESALALVADVRAPALAAAVRRQRVQILLDGARSAASSGDALVALQRAQQLGRMDIPADLRAQADSASTAADLAAAPRLLAANRPAEAVAALDDAIRRDSRSADGLRAVASMPPTLLAAGTLSLLQFDTGQALTVLRRITVEYPSSSEARTARGALAAGQDVAGTVVHKDGSVVTGNVRLAANFVPSPRGDYALGPYYSGFADTAGDFTITNVPVGGPYVVEVERNGAWVTPVDRDSGRPAYEASVTPLAPVDLTFVILPN